MMIQVCMFINFFVRLVQLLYVEGCNLAAFTIPRLGSGVGSHCDFNAAADAHSKNNEMSSVYIP